MSDLTIASKSNAGLSVSMIVRNEAARLPECIAAVGPIANEICIVDTGSSDDTMAIARDLGCRVAEFPWCDDFSAARNAALALCRFSWILSLDADEIVAGEDHEALGRLIQAETGTAYRMVTRTYTNDLGSSGFEPMEDGDTHGTGFVGWYPSAKVRLFPNSPEIRFEGVLHELVNASVQRTAIPTVDTTIPIHHYPGRHQRKDAQEAKQQLYLALGKKKVAAFPDLAKAHGELGDQYMDMGAYGAAVTSYKQALLLEPKGSLWLKNMGSALFLLGHEEPARKALRLAVALTPSLEEGWRNLGVVMIRQGDWEGARSALEKALALNDRHPDNYRYLAIAHSHGGDVSAALSLLERLLTRFPKNTEGQALYIRLTRASGPSPAS